MFIKMVQRFFLIQRVGHFYKSMVNMNKYELMSRYTLIKSYLCMYKNEFISTNFAKGSGWKTPNSNMIAQPPKNLKIKNNKIQ